MGLVTTEAIVLKNMPLGEADKLVTFLTQKRGKVSGVARGARRVKSRFSAACEPFSHLRVIFFEKRPDTLLRISQMDILRPFQTIRADLEKMMRGARATSLIGRFSPEREENPQLFSLLLTTLSLLEKGGDMELITQLAEIRLLALSGYQPRLTGCVRCKGKIQDLMHFSPEAGGFICHHCIDGADSGRFVVPRKVIAFYQLALRMGFPLMDRVRVPEEIKQTLGEILEASLAYILGRSPLPIFEMTRSPL